MQTLKTKIVQFATVAFALLMLAAASSTVVLAQDGRSVANATNKPAECELGVELTEDGQAVMDATGVSFDGETFVFQRDLVPELRKGKVTGKKVPRAMSLVNSKEPNRSIQVVGFGEDTFYIFMEECGGNRLVYKVSGGIWRGKVVMP